MGPITKFLREDHARLGALFDRAARASHDVDLEPFGAFRTGLLRHIGMEERIILPALLRRPGAPLKLAEKLRLDHGALTNLFVPQPSREILSAILSILEPHNRLEEEPGGFYDTSDSLLASEADALTQKMRASPEPPLRPYSGRPEALEAAKRAMRRAGFDWDRCVMTVRENVDFKPSRAEARGAPRT